MSGERHDQVAEELERELREALALEPSPDFARGVRARIVQDAARRAPVVFRREVALAAAAVCVLAIALGWRATRELDPPAPRLATHVGSDVVLEGPPAPAGKSAPAVVRTPPRQIRAAVFSESVATGEPEVIVPPDRAHGLARFLELARSGRLDEETLRPLAPPAAPATLDVAPLVVPAISVTPVDFQNGAPAGDAERE